MIRVGVIGYGYWGPNVARNFDGVAGSKVASICDLNPESLLRARKAFPAIDLTCDCRDIVRSSAIDAIAVVTPVSTHFTLAKMALENGKHVFVEKPFTRTAAEAEQLIDLAARKNLTIMVDHTFLFTSAVRAIKQLIHDDVLGPLYYYDSTRVNLGLIQSDVNVLWDLGAHDLSIMDYLVKDRPVAIAATGATHVNGVENVAYMTLYFQNSLIAHINVNWLSPVKVRTTLFGGQKKMLLWNDLEPDEKIKVYDKGIEVTDKEGVYKLLVSYRSGDMWAPKIDHVEALEREAEYFVECIERNEAPFNDGEAGLRVVRMLEAADRSLKKRGKLVCL